MIARVYNRIRSSKVAKAFGIYTIAKVINSCIPFIMLPIMTAYLSPSDYGVISMISTVMAFLLPFVTLNTDNAVIRRYYYKDASIPKYVGNCIMIVLSSCVLITILFFVFSTPLSRLTQIPKYALYILPLWCVFRFFNDITLYNWQCKGEPVKFGAFSISMTFVELTIAILLIVGLKFDWNGRLISMFSTAMFFAIFSYIYLSKKNMIQYKADKGDMQHAIKYGSGLILSAIGGTMMTLANRFFITNMVSVEETGFYSVANSLSGLMAFITVSFNNAFLPYVFQTLTKGNEKDKLKIVKITYAYMISLVGLAFVVYFFILFIFPFFVNNKFEPSMKYVPWLLTGNVLQGCYFMVTNYPRYVEKTYYNGIVTIICGVLSIIFNFVLIKWYGAVGASMAFALSYLFFFVIMWIVAARVYKMPWNLKIDKI